VIDVEEKTDGDDALIILGSISLMGAVVVATFLYYYK